MAKNTKHKHIKQQKEAAAGERIIGQTSRNLITRLKNHDPNSPNRQDTDVSKHFTDNPDHKIDFDKTEIMAQTNNWRKL